MLSKDAEQALINARHYGQGAKVETAPDVLKELQHVGMVGPGGGLTRRGTIRRERLQAAALNAAFG